MVKRILACLLCLLVIMSLGACGEQQIDDSYMYNFATDCQIIKDMTANDVCCVKNESGYYVNVSKYVYFVDSATMEATPLCAKPNCLHNDETCNSYIGTTQGLTYNNGKIYTVVEAGPEYHLEGSCFNYISADGSEHETFAHVKENVQDWIIHRGYVYYSIKKGVFEEAITLENFGDVQAAVLRFPLNSPDKQELVYSSAEGLKDAYLYKLKAFGDYMYFMEQGKDSDDYRFDWKRVNLTDLTVSDIVTSQGITLGIPYLLGNKLLMRGEKLGDGSYQFYLCEVSGENAEKFFVSTNHQMVSTDGTYIYFDDLLNLFDSEVITENSKRKVTVYDSSFQKVDEFYIINKYLVEDCFASVDDRFFMFGRKLDDDSHWIYYYDKSEFGSLNGCELKNKTIYKEIK